MSNGTVKPEEELDYIQVYKYITNEFFERVLKKVHGDTTQIVVRDFSLNAALPKFENFLSQMVRANVNYSTNGGDNLHKKLILKLSLANQEVSDLMTGSINTFVKEINLYGDILPKVHALLRGIGDDTKLAPICYEYDSVQQYLVFEDLSVDAYCNIDKQVGFQHQHLMALYTKLAKYHAGTAKLLLDNEIDTSLFAVNVLAGTDSFIEFFKVVLDLAAEEIAKWDGFTEIASKLKRLKTKYFKMVKDSVIRDPTELILVTHGDLWSNNIMYKFTNDGQVEDVLMVDFQCGYHGSPVHDIAYSYFTSTDRKMSEEDFDLAVQHYHKTLSDTLKAFNYPADKIPTLLQLRATFFRRTAIEIALAMHMNSFKGEGFKWSFDVEEMFDVSKINMKSHEKRYNRPAFRDCTEKLVVYMDRKGLLN